MMNGSRQHITLKSQLLLVKFHFVSSQFQINSDHFYLLFPTYVQFFTQIVDFKSLFSSQHF